MSTSTFCLSEGNCDFLAFGSASTFCLDEFTSIFSLDNFESVLFNLLSILFIFSSCSFIFADGFPSPFIISLFSILLFFISIPDSTFLSATITPDDISLFEFIDVFIVPESWDDVSFKFGFVPAWTSGESLGNLLNVETESLYPTFPSVFAVASVNAGIPTSVPPFASFINLYFGSVPTAPGFCDCKSVNCSAFSSTLFFWRSYFRCAFSTLFFSVSTTFGSELFVFW